MRLIVDINSSQKAANILSGDVLLTSNKSVASELDNARLIDYSCLDQDTRTAKAIDDYFNQLPSSFAPFKNEYYMRVFRPVFAIIFQIQRECKLSGIKVIVLERSAGFPFITLFGGMGEGEKLFFKDSWLLNYFIVEYFKDSYVCEYEGAPHSLRLFYHFREIIIIVIRLARLSLRSILYRSKGNSLLEKKKYWIFVDLPLQVAHFKNTFKSLSNENSVFISTSKIDVGDSAEFFDYTPSLSNISLALIRFFKDINSCKQVSEGMSIMCNNIAVSNRYVYKSIIISYVQYYSRISYFDDLVSFESVQYKPTILSNMTFGTDISLVHHIASKAGLIHCNYQAVNMPRMCYPKVDLADRFYMYNEDSLSFYSRLHRSYQYYLPIFEEFCRPLDSPIVLVVFTQPDSFTNDYIELLRKLSKAVHDNGLNISVVVKLHYRQDRVKEFKEIVSTSKSMVLAREEQTVPSLLMSATFALSITSAVLFEAFQYGCPGLIYDLGEVNSKYTLHNCVKNVNMTIISFEGLLEVLSMPEKFHNIYDARRRSYLAQKSLAINTPIEELLG